MGIRVCYGSLRCFFSLPFFPFSSHFIPFLLPTPFVLSRAYEPGRVMFFLFLPLDSGRRDVDFWEFCEKKVGAASRRWGGIGQDRQRYHIRVRV